MHFVSNNHILVRFKNSKTIILRSNGTLVNQAQEVHTILDNPMACIQAKTCVEAGKMFLSLYDSKKDEYDVILFDQFGIGKVVGNFQDSYDKVKEMIKIDPSINKDLGKLNKKQE